MATVTIGKSYFDALLRRAEFHTSGNEFLTAPSLSNNVTISKAEHEHLMRSARELHALKKALFRGGLTVETLETLLAGETGLEDEPGAYTSNPWEDNTFARPKTVPVTISGPRYGEGSPDSENTAVGDGLHPRSHSNSYSRVYSFGQPDSSIDTPDKDDDFLGPAHQRIPTHDQRTVLITNLSDRTTHKDLTNIMRGGRLLDIFLRNDRSATVSFVEGAREFLAYAKKNDIYLHTKRLEFKWSDRQFHVPPHVSNKIANGATRNLAIRGAAGKHTADEIRDHLDHIHNLVVVDIYFKNCDAYVSTNSVHNALFARTCMMSRTAYKGMRIDWYPDECATPLPKPPSRAQIPAQQPLKPAPVTNLYTLLDSDGNDLDTDEEEESYLSNGVPVNNWADATAA
ncbi:hypothetical protein BCR34DRAFT_606690 [Clohesyomyces aquaticus]|uniref:RRM domain-containing protein n=1 Tax=Clohesyomyces aquaticus TaxID=1231657 RepID=A0A1Y1YMK9_9PLEO|nr:hypothetical protein BCR34DRAFT_606690 [Clohesyomyces aquaticus]